MHVPTLDQLKRILPFKAQIERAEAEIAEILAEIEVGLFPGPQPAKPRKTPVRRGRKASVRKAAPKGKLVKKVPAKRGRKPKKAS